MSSWTRPIGIWSSGPNCPWRGEYSPKMISVSSLSKTYGCRASAWAGSSARDRPLFETFLAAKEQIHICGPVVDEELAYRYLLHKDKHFPRIAADIRDKFETVKHWMQQQEDWGMGGNPRAAA